MICWKCLVLMVHARNENGDELEYVGCPSCGLMESEEESVQARAEFFKALVAGDIINPMRGGAEHSVRRATATMSEIERRVEAGTLFGGGGREEGA